MRKNYALAIVALWLAFAALATAGDGKWAFNSDTGQGSIERTDVERALGRSVSYAEAQGFSVTVVDTVDGCVRERPLDVMTRHNGNDSKRDPRFNGYWAFGYLASDGGCGSSLRAGPNATVHVNGIPLE